MRRLPGSRLGLRRRPWRAAGLAFWERPEMKTPACARPMGTGAGGRRCCAPRDGCAGRLGVQIGPLLADGAPGVAAATCFQSCLGRYCSAVLADRSRRNIPGCSAAVLVDPQPYHLDADLVRPSTARVNPKGPGPADPQPGAGLAAAPAGPGGTSRWVVDQARQAPRSQR